MKLLWFIVSVFIYSSLSAQVYTNEKLGISFHLSVNEGWQPAIINDETNGGVQYPVELILNSTNQNNGKKFILTVIKTDSLSNLSDIQQRNEIKAGVLESMNNQGKVVLEKIDKFANVLSYEFTVIQDFGEGEMSMRFICLVNNDFYYSITLISNEVNNLPDNDFNSVLTSFKFLERNDSTLPTSTEKPIAYKIGQLSFVIILLAIIYFVVSKVRKKRKVA